MDKRKTRGIEIVEKPNQVLRIDDTHYEVKSQSRDKYHDVISTERGWECACEDYQARRSPCKHIHAVDISVMIRSKIEAEVEISEIRMDSCKYCRSKHITKMGIRHNRSGDVQMLSCKACSRKFSINIGFEKMRATPDQITMAMNMYFNGESTRKTAQAMSVVGVHINHMTVYNWVKKYVTLMEKYLDDITPQVGESWRTDEVYLRIKGDRRYLFALLDSDTRFWLAAMVAEHKGNDDVEPMFEAARKSANKVPQRLISDGAENFRHAWKKQYRPKNFLHKDSEHHRHIHMAGDMNNNQMESFNGNTVRAREKVIRGIKRDDSVVLKGMKLHHNFIKRHQGLDGDTPADRAGIRVKGANKWKTIIQNAAKKQ